MPAAPATATTFRLARTSYLVLLFLYIGSIPVALAGTGEESSPVATGWPTLIFLIPILATAFVVRTATIVDGEAITVRAILGSRRMTWDTIRGVSVSGSTIYAVQADGSVRLPCVQIADLAALSRAAGGRLPEIDDTRPKQPPTRQRRG